MKAPIDLLRSNIGFKSHTVKGLTLLLMVLLGAIALRVAWRDVTVHTDEAEYGYSAMMWSDGHPPYLLREDMQPPMVYFLYLVGGSLENVRILNDLLFFVSVIVVFYLAKELLDVESEAFVAAALYAIFMSVPALEGQFALPASMAVPLIVASFYFGVVYWRNEKKRFLMIAGIFASAGGLLYAREFSFLIILMFMILERGLSLKVGWSKITMNARIRPIMMGVLFLMFGTIILPLSFALYYASYGRIDALVSGLLRPLHVSYDLVGLPPFPISWAIITILEISPLLIFSLIGVIIAIRRKSRNGILLTFMFALAFVVNFLVHRYFGHYWLNLVVPSVLLASPVITALTRTIRQRTHFLRPKNNVSHYVRTSFAISLLMLSSFISGYMQVQQYPTGSISSGYFEMVYSPFGSYQNQTLLATFLRNNTSQDDQILAHGWMPEVYYLSGIRAPSPYLATFYVGSSIPEAEYQRLQYMVVQQEFKYVVLSHWANWDTDSIAALTRAYYDEIGRVGYCELYARQALYPFLKNPGFEDLSDWIITNTTYAAYARACAHSGNQSLAVTQDNDFQSNLVYQEVPVKGNAEYVLSAWGINAPRNDIWLSIAEIDINGALLRHTIFTTNFFSLNEWSPTAYRFSTLPETAKVRININILALGLNYTTYFDDIQLFAVQP